MANIRTARRSGRVFRGGKSVRETLWVGLAATRSNITAPSTALIINSASAGFLALRPFTIVRTRGWFFVGSDQTAAAETYGASLGFSVVSDQALAIGITAVPTPETDADSDAFWVYESITGEMKVISAIGFADPSGVGKDYDSRAMRKVEDGFQIIFVLETDLAALTAGTITRHRARVLWKLH